ncbi:MAG TPA: class I SAM-dependent rRNA methyltransferase [Ktedonobacterales bacterium]|nr:class I SAM-dependent rRNA methyltransferase [Ktedonobacterales bacterium]
MNQTGDTSDTGETIPRLTLQPGRDYTLLHGHPWLFSGAFRALPSDLPAGVVADVVNAAGQWVARGHLNARNSLAFRLLTRDPDEAIDAPFYARRIERAAGLRRLLPADVTGYRLVNAEGDGLPGLIVDRYDRWLVAQFSTAGAERQRELILDALEQTLAPAGVLVRDDIRVREREGLAVGGASVARGEIPEEIEIREGAVRYLIDPRGGQKTGFFLDQREKRQRTYQLAPHLSSLLNLFSYSGGFALAGLAGNPALRTVNVDSSGPALALARRNYQLNGYDPDAPDTHRFEERDVTRYLQAAGDTGQRFGLVVVDPPAYARSNAKKERALHAYEQLNALAARVVAADGLLLTCSCSGAVNAAEFEAAVRAGLVRAGRAAQLLEVFGPALDHPSLPGFPEDRYLKALLLRLV